MGVIEGFKAIIIGTAFSLTNWVYYGKTNSNQINDQAMFNADHQLNNEVMRNSDEEKIGTGESMTNLISSFDENDWEEIDSKDYKLEFFKNTEKFSNKDENESYGEKIIEISHKEMNILQNEQIFIEFIKYLDKDYDDLKIINSFFTDNSYFLNHLLKVCISSHVQRLNFQNCQFPVDFGLENVPKPPKDKLRCLYSL